MTLETKGTNYPVKMCDKEVQLELHMVGFQWWIHKVGGLWSLVLVLHGLLDIPSCSWYWVHFQKFIPSWSSCCTICVIFISAWALVLGTFEKIHTKLVLIRIYIFFNSVVSKVCKTFPKF